MLNTTAPLSIPFEEDGKYNLVVKANRKLAWLKISLILLLALLFFVVIVFNNFHPEVLNFSPKGNSLTVVGTIAMIVSGIGMILILQSNTVIITSEKVFLSIEYLPISPFKDKSVEYFFDDIVSCEMETQPLMPGSLSPSLINKLVISYRNEQGEVCKSKVKLSFYIFKTDPCWIEFVINKLMGCEDQEGFLESLSHLPQGLRVP